MTLTVYGAPLSPFVRKLRLCLAEKGLAYQHEMTMPGEKADWFRDMSPLGRIPALRDGDFTLADSSVICQYLEAQYPESTPLYGRDAQETARIRWLEKYADYELGPLATFCVFRNRIVKPTLGQSCDEQIVQTALHEKLPPHFDYLEKTLGQAEYFVGNRLSIADLAIACQLINMAHGGERLDAQRWPALAALVARIEQRDSVQNLLPGEQATVAKIRSKFLSTAP
ncbi:glutathione S-transferase family protein [Pseudomonas sp. UL073]|uniref:Glutathione S-transferase family protein n=1 Tax=Zestomonas insulae TaxID=2809017 RepID=A0ABS2IAD5_9GAMM|nr:glutathione S-transferase family protein [Pseudomonas insulae]MBM7059219.1 glutathione S-transferase family protein [Pseudomonas insulae]